MGLERPEFDLEKRTGCGKCGLQGRCGLSGRRKSGDRLRQVYHVGGKLSGGCQVLCQRRIHLLRQRGKKLSPHEGWILQDFVSREDIMPLIERILEVYKEQVKPGMRLREFINTTGFEEFEKIHPPVGFTRCIQCHTLYTTRSKCSPTDPGRVIFTPSGPRDPIVHNRETD